MGHSGCRGRGPRKHRRVPPTTSIPPSGSSATSFTKPIPQWDEIAMCGRCGCLVNQPSGPSYDNCCRFFSSLILALLWNKDKPGNQEAIGADQKLQKEHDRFRLSEAFTTTVTFTPTFCLPVLKKRLMNVWGKGEFIMWFQLSFIV